MLKFTTWGFPVALYLFVGGLSAAAYYVGVIADLVSKGRFRNMAKVGSYIVLAPICLGLFMLLIDLGKPLSFWHLLVQAGPLNNGLIFRASSVMSVGTWLLVAFSLLCGVAYPLMWLAEDKKIPFLSGLAGREGLRRTVGILGLPFALMVAAYTGVLLAVSAKPVWADTPLLPMLFVVSATSTGIAAIILALYFFKQDDCESIKRLEKGDSILIKLELAVVGMLTVWLLFSPSAAGLMKNLLIGDYAVFLWLGFIIPGLLLPLLMQGYSLRNHGRAPKTLAVASALLVLVGGFFLRYVVILAV